LADHVLEGGVLLIEGDTIVNFGTVDEVFIPETASKIDAKNAYVGPGFVDIHVHGGNGFSTCFDPKQAAEFFLQHGTTTMLATPAYSMDLDTMLSAIRSVKASLHDAPTIRGLYMEGPYTNPKYGANANTHPWRHPIDEAQYRQLVDEAGELAKVWVIAPEREGLLPFLEYARKVNPNVKFAVGHSEATPSQIRALGQYGPALHTHVTDATGRQPVTAGTRGCGPDEYCFVEPEVYGEVISDSQGIHVCADMQKLILHCKGVHRTVLITDSTRLNNPNSPALSHVTDLNFSSIGELAGSKLTMDQALRNVMAHTGCSIVDAFLMASTNPARALEFDDIGSIQVGKKADLVFLDDAFRLQQVILRGECV
jgi:N-acetylglucosamine-6-phosphate deacetylase